MAAAAAGIAAGGGIIESAIQMGVSHKMAKNQREWQQKMAETAYQRTVKDMRKAGLNPILATKLGGTTAGPGASATAQRGNVTGSAMQAYKLGSEVTLLKEQAKLAEQDRWKSAANTAAAYAAAEKAQAETQIIGAGVTRAKDVEKFDKSTPGSWFRYLREASRAIQGK